MEPISRRQAARVHDLRSPRLLYSGQKLSLLSLRTTSLYHGLHRAQLSIFGFLLWSPISNTGIICINMVVPTASAAVPAPSGESTDFNAPNELWQWNILCQSLCLGIPGILWMLRLYVRVWIKRVWIFEDCMRL